MSGVIAIIVALLVSAVALAMDFSCGGLRRYDSVGYVMGQVEFFSGDYARAHSAGYGDGYVSGEDSAVAGGHADSFAGGCFAPGRAFGDHSGAR